MAKIDIQPSYTVSGLLFKVDKTPYEQYSSPVYSLSTNEEGQEVMTRDDALYLFTDQDGRFILSDVLPGDYLFDLRVDDLWYAVRFTVPEVEAGKTGKNRVLLLEQFWIADPELEERIIVKDAFTQEEVEEEIDVFGTELVTGYDANVTLEVIERIDEESFWKIIFPSFEQDDWSFDTISEPEINEDDFFFVEMGDQQVPQQKTIMIDPETMQNTPKATPSDATVMSFVPSAPSFASIRVQSIESYENEQQTLLMETIEEEPFTEMVLPEIDEETSQDPPLNYSAP